MVEESSSYKANNKKRDLGEISWCLQCSGSSQIPSQNDLNDYHQFLSLYKFNQFYDRTELIIYDTENEKEQLKVYDTKILLDKYTSITQLPNGELFCYGGYKSGVTLIIDKSYEIRMLPSGTSCRFSSALFFNNNIYCFGGYNKGLSRKFDLEKNRWDDLASLPKPDACCRSVIFNGNILISGFFCTNLWLYSIEIDSFSIIPYDFLRNKIKLIINVERLYLIEWDINGSIYESEDEYHWNPISKSGQLDEGYQIYCLYNKDKIYISTWYNYYQFDLKKTVILEIK